MSLFTRRQFPFHRNIFRVTFSGFLFSLSPLFSSPMFEFEAVRVTSLHFAVTTKDEWRVQSSPLIPTVRSRKKSHWHFLQPESVFMLELDCSGRDEGGKVRGNMLYPFLTSTFFFSTEGKKVSAKESRKCDKFRLWRRRKKSKKENFCNDISICIESSSHVLVIRYTTRVILFCWDPLQKILPSIVDDSITFHATQICLLGNEHILPIQSQHNPVFAYADFLELKLFFLLPFL